jgi:hypothetical protein
MTDILVHGLDVSSAEAAKMVREIVSLADEKTRRELADLLFTKYNALARPNVAKLERYLTELRDKLTARCCRSNLRSFAARPAIIRSVLAPRALKCRPNVSEG